MRQSFPGVLAAVAGLATTSNAYYSEYWTDWEGSLAAIQDGPNCGNGPAVCGADADGNAVACMDGYACFRSAFGDICDDVARYQCYTECAEGETRNPLRYCQCITIEDRDAMFCEPAPEEEGEDIVDEADDEAAAEGDDAGDADADDDDNSY